MSTERLQEAERQKGTGWEREIWRTRERPTGSPPAARKVKLVAKERMRPSSKVDELRKDRLLERLVH